MDAARALAEETGTDEEAREYENGFTIKTVIGALFIGFIMMPGAMYMGLVAGQGLGPAAQWVTIVLFAEVARRSFVPLKRAEIYTLYY
ncbi:MAG: peptide transporter, partial [Armatimonadota bacterium]